MLANTPIPACADVATTPLDKDVKAEILAQVAARGPGKTICPSEVARALAKDWRVLMPEIRDAARSLAADGSIVVTQKGKPVDALSAKGPIRLGVPQDPG